MSDDTQWRPIAMTPEQQAARAPLVEAGWRILDLLGRVSDQATDEQVREARRNHQALCAIWNDALAEPLPHTH